MKQLKYYLCFSLIICFSFSDAQKPDSISEIQLAFVNHWMNIGEYEDAVYIINKYLAENMDQDVKDSFYFLKAWCFYNMKELDSAICYFDLIPDSFSRYGQSVFFTSYLRAYNGLFAEADSILANYQPVDSNQLRLQNLERAGYALLKRDFTSYDHFAGEFDQSYFGTAKEERNLKDHFNEMMAFKRKSPLVAGTLSALVPGLGKVYAGRLGEGISAFLVISSLGLVAFENYRKDGILDPKTLLFGSIFTTYYIGNIWGSVFSVKLEQQEFNNAVNHYILFDLHIPLRNMFYR